MKIIRRTLGGLAIVGGFIALFSQVHAQTTVTFQSLRPDSTNDLAAIQATAAKPMAEGFYCAARREFSSLRPNHIPGLDACDFGNGFFLPYDFIVGDAMVGLGLQTLSMSLERTSVLQSGYGELAYGNNDLWLEIAGVSNGLAYLNLHNATDEVYEVWSKIDLLATNWNIEQEIWPETNQDMVPFTVPQLDRTNLFIWARDWTGIDENSNGIPDWWEYKYFGHLGIDPNADPDGDGFSNLQECQNGTDPLNADSAPGLLGRWHFDNTSWLGVQGQVPLLATNLQLVSGLSSNAVELDIPDAYLGYRSVEDNGHPNLNLQSGTVRFWFCPRWSSANKGGTGLSDWPTLIEVNPGLAFWGCYIYPDGNTLELAASADGSDGSWDYVDGTVSWTSNQWHQVVVTYSLTNTALYLDGVLAATGDNSATIPASDEFLIGNDYYGNPAMGRFDELDTFDYPLSAERIASDFQSTLNLLSLEIISGNNQMGPSGSFLVQPLVVQATGANLETLSNAPITFTVTCGEVQLAVTTNDPVTTNLTLNTGSEGLDSVWIYFPTATNLLENVVSVQAAGTPVTTNASSLLK